MPSAEVCSHYPIRLYRPCQLAMRLADPKKTQKNLNNQVN